VRPWSAGCRYRVHFEDGRDVTTNYVGEVLQVSDDITLEGWPWVITDAKVLSERDMDFEIHVRRPRRPGIERSRRPIVVPGSAREKLMPPRRFSFVTHQGLHGGG
jgi:hypothetical protein